MSPLHAFLAEMAADRKFIVALADKPSLAQSFDDLRSYFQQLEEVNDSPIAIDLYDAIVEIVRRQAPLKDRALAMYQVMKASLPAVPTKYGQ
jgi:hypothetical protein